MSLPRRSRAICKIFFFSFLSFLMLAAGTESRAQTANANASPAEQEILREINLLRSNPQAYAAYLEQMRASYVGNRFQPAGRTAIITSEGVRALDEAIQYLRAARALPPFEMSRGLSSAARDHVRDIGQRSMRGHRGSDGSIPNDRVNRYGSFTGGIGECIEYQNETARETVIKWLIDDGFPPRAHRNSILSPTYRMIGLAVGDCSTGGQMCVLTLTGGFAERTTTAARPIGSTGGGSSLQPTARPITTTRTRSQ